MFLTEEANNLKVPPPYEVEIWTILAWKAPMWSSIAHKKGLVSLLMYIHQIAVKEGESSFSGKFSRMSRTFGMFQKFQKCLLGFLKHLAFLNKIKLEQGTIHFKDISKLFTIFPLTPYCRPFFYYYPTANLANFWPLPP